ncbi:O-methyltransferase [Saccharothrix longispora]|uniref:O-methyltransferase n=1 Tax=Saccharothrix longispora TaxID=33920 RepID=UPI0028FD8130|nr:class I SAM-dependent methyltransferase [Saccharothrix longispora]MDU0292976.1 class I SAM-dependent methyltransferase [Saccharothrix longispora]
MEDDVKAAGLPEGKHVPVNQVLRSYLLGSCTPPHPAVRDLAARTASVGAAAGMMVPPEQAALLTMLTRIVSPMTVIDIGTFTGLSALSFALGLPPGGKVITCDVTDEWEPIAREHWQQAGVAELIEFHRGPAERTLRDLPAGTTADIVFIDADKLNYPKYIRAAVPLLRQGGLLIVDNVLLDGYVLDAELADTPLMRLCAAALREVNAALAKDDRFDTVMLPLADGLTIARKR